MLSVQQSPILELVLCLSDSTTAPGIGCLKYILVDCWKGYSRNELLCVVVRQIPKALVFEFGSIQHRSGFPNWCRWMLRQRMNQIWNVSTYLSANENGMQDDASFLLS